MAADRTVSMDNDPDRKRIAAKGAAEARIRMEDGDKITKAERFQIETFP